MNSHSPRAQAASAPLDVAAVAPNLQRFVTAHYGPSARAANVEPMALGHAGLTYGFDVVEGADRTRARFVLRLAPPGVRRHGNTDVYRQAPLLRALHSQGQPVPNVPWASPDEDWFGTPFIMMERLSGLPCLIWDPDPQFPRTDEAIGANAFLSSVLGSIPEAVVVLGADLVITAWSEAAGEIWGLRPDEAEGQYFLNLDIGLPTGELLPTLRACLAGESRGSELTVSAVNRRGRPVRCTVTCSPLLGGGGEIHGGILLMEVRDGTG